MTKLEIEGREFDVDGDGFLKQPELWTEEVATLFAKTDGTGELNEKHWAIINYIRKNWEETDMAEIAQHLIVEPEEIKIDYN